MKNVHVTKHLTQDKPLTTISDMGHPYETCSGVTPVKWVPNPCLNFMLLLIQLSFIVGIRFSLTKSMPSQPDPFLPKIIVDSHCPNCGDYSPFFSDVC